MPFAGYQATSIIEKAKHVHQLLFTSMLYLRVPQNISANSQFLFPSIQVPEEWLHITKFRRK